MRQGQRETYFAGLLTAIHGNLGQVEQAKSAFSVFEQEQQEYSGGVMRLHAVMWLYPFSEPDVLDRLANGLRAAGVSIGIGGYLPLNNGNRLSGDEIKALLFGKEIKGHWFWWGGLRTWRQERTMDGAVIHSGWRIHSYVPSGGRGTGRIEGDMLCEQWGDLPKDLEICVVIFRIPEGDARMRWGEYVMVTEIGPNPFRLVE